MRPLASFERLPPFEERYARYEAAKRLHDAQRGPRWEHYRAALAAWEDLPDDKVFRMAGEIKPPRPRAPRGPRPPRLPDGALDVTLPTGETLTGMRWIAIDIEAKKDDSDAKGFTRPFLAGARDIFTRERQRCDVCRSHRCRFAEEHETGGTFASFRNDPDVDRLLPWSERAYASGGCVDRLMRHVLVRRYAGWRIIAHAGGTFDFLHLIPWLRRPDVSARFAFRYVRQMSGILLLTVRERSTGLEWTLYDTYRLLPVSLDKAARAFGVAGKLSHDLDLPERDPRWEAYLRQDCEALARVYERAADLIVRRLGGLVMATAAATSMTTFRTRWMGGPLAHGGPKTEHGLTIPRSACWRRCEEKAARWRRGAHEWQEHRARLADLRSRLRLATSAKKRDPDAIRALRRELAAEERKKIRSPGTQAPPCGGCLHEWIRRGYVGGRTEVFRLWSTNNRYLDFTASYAACATERMPCDQAIEVRGAYFARMSHEERLRDVEKRIARGLVGFIEADVWIPESCAIPPLPVRYGRSPIFPVGSFGGVFDAHELALLRDVGGEIQRIRRAVWYASEPFMAPYVGELWKLRDKSSPDYNAALDAIAKLFINTGIYGKYGQRPEREKLVAESRNQRLCEACGAELSEDEGAAWAARRHAYRLCQGCVGCVNRWRDPEEHSTCACADCAQRPRPLQEVRETSEGLEEVHVGLWAFPRTSRATFIMPQVAAHVTALGRIKLWRELLSKGGASYTDTDSAITTAAIASSNRLGGAKDEYPGVTFSGVFLSPKTYKLAREGTKDPIEGCHAADCEDRKSCKGCSHVYVRMKGVPRELAHEQSFDRFARGEPIVSRGRLQKIGSMQRAGLAPPKTVTVKRTFKTRYWKRRCYVDGSTRPLVFRDGLPVGDSLEWLRRLGVCDAEGKPYFRGAADDKGLQLLPLDEERAAAEE